jgi:HEAT repeat protein
MIRGIWDRLRRYLRGRSRNLDTLSRDLQHPDASVRKAAARALGELGSTEGILVLFGAIHDRNEEVRQEVVASLERLGWEPPADGETIDLPSPDGSPSSEIRRVLPSYLPVPAQELVPLLRDPDPAIRRETAQTLGALGDPEAIDPLLQALEDSDPSVQQATQEALKRLGWSSEMRIPQDPVEKGRFLVAQKQWAELESMGKMAVNPLIEALDHPDKYVRWRAARTLGRLGSSRAIEPLIRILRDPDPGVRKGAAYALGRLTGEQFVSPLDQVLNEKDEILRLEAATILGSQKDAQYLVEALIPVLSPDMENPDDHVRTLATEILSRLSGSSVSLDAIHFGGVRNTDQKSTSTESTVPSSGSIPERTGGGVQVEAASMVVAGTSSIAVPTIQPQTESAESRPGSIGDVMSLETLIELLADPSQEGQIPEIVALGLGEESHGLVAGQTPEKGRKVPPIPTLVHALGTSDAAMRGVLQEALVRVGAPAVEPLINAFKDRNTELRARAAKVLVALGKLSVEPLTHTLQDSSDLVRWRAARTLGEIGDPSAIPSLIDALGEDDILLRRDAADALARMGSPALDPLIHAVQEGKPQVQKEAAEVLGRLGDSRAIEPLRAVLAETGSEIRCAAIWALGELGDTQLEEVLRPCLEDPDRQVSGAARIALERTGRKTP